MIHENQQHIVDAAKAAGQVIGRLRNNWRQREVVVYAIPECPSTAYTVGTPFGGGQPIECLERVGDWKRVIDLFPTTAVYD